MFKKCTIATSLAVIMALGACQAPQPAPEATISDDNGWYRSRVTLAGEPLRERAAASETWLDDDDAYRSWLASRNDASLGWQGYHPGPSLIGVVDVHEHLSIINGRPVDNTRIHRRTRAIYRR